MDLQNVDMGSQSRNTLVNSIKDMLPAQANLIDHLAIICTRSSNRWLASIARNSEIAFAQDDDFVSRDIVFLEGLADDLFRASVGVDICCVPCVETDIVGMLEEWEGFFFVEYPFLPIKALKVSNGLRERRVMKRSVPVRASHRHRSIDDLGDLEAGIA